MTGVELITAALAAGAGAGASGLATAATNDAYTGLRDALRRRFTGRRQAEQALAAEETDPGVWQTRLGDAVTEVGADHDEEVLAAARRLLALVDPAETQAGKYAVDLRGAQGVQVGDGTVHVDTNQGGAVGTFNAPVSFGTPPPIPPAAPGTA